MARKGLTTPRVRTIFRPYLWQPDTAFKADGEYKISVLMSPEDAAALQDRIDTAIEEQYQKECENAKAELLKKTPKATPKAIAAAQDKINKSDTGPIKAELDRETGEETGMMVVTFKRSVKRDKDGNIRTSPPLVKSTSLTTITSPLFIGTGSLVQVGYTLNPFYVPAVGVGCTLALDVVVIRKREDNQAEYDFEAEEGDEDYSDAEADATDTADGEGTSGENGNF